MLNTCTCYALITVNPYDVSVNFKYHLLYNCALTSVNIHTYMVSYPVALEPPLETRSF